MRSPRWSAPAACYYSPPVPWSRRKTRCRSRRSSARTGATAASRPPRYPRSCLRPRATSSCCPRATAPAARMPPGSAGSAEMAGPVLARLRGLLPATVRGRNRLRAGLLLVGAALAGYLVTCFAYPAPLESHDREVGRLLGLPLEIARQELA